MKKDPKRVIAEIAEHTGYTLSKEELDSVEEYTRFYRIRKEIIEYQNDPETYLICSVFRFDNMSKTCAMNKPSPIYHENRGKFMRKGKVKK